MFAVWLAVFVACFALGRRRPSRRDVVVTVPFLLLAFWAQRNIALSPLVGVAAAARCVAPRRVPRRPTDSPLNRIVAVALLALGSIWTAQAAGEPNFDTPSTRWPPCATSTTTACSVSGLMTDDAWGGYVILKYWPQQKVFVDDRYDMYPRPVLEDFIRFSDADRRWREILDRYRIDVVVWPAKAPDRPARWSDPAPGGNPLTGTRWRSVFTRAARQRRPPRRQ